MNLVIPDLCLVALIGPSGCGKSSFAKKHFQPTEVLSSDFFRALVGDDEANQAASADAFEVLHLVAEKRLAAGRLTVVDATNVQHTLRGQLVSLARRHHCQPVAIVFDLPEALCQEWNRQRPGRIVPASVVHEQWGQLRRSIGQLADEGFRSIFVLASPEQLDQAAIERQPPPGAGDELVDVIDTAGNTIGTVTRREMRARRLPHRCVYILVFNGQGELFVHLRTSTKDVYPSHWDVAVGGVLAAGESFDAGARRELQEELGVSAELELLFPFRHDDPNTDVQAMVYRAVHDGPFRLQPEEVVEGKFLSVGDVDRQAAGVPFCPDGLAVLAEYRKLLVD